MEREITPEQNEQLNTWAGKRDEILLEISVLKTYNEELDKKNIELSESNTDIQTRVNELRGELKELKIKESELPKLITKEMVPLEARKTKLETEMDSLTKSIISLKELKESLEKDVKKELETLDSLHQKSGKLEKVIGHVTKISSDNEAKVFALLKKVQDGLEEIENKNKQVVSSADSILVELPKVFLEIKKQSLERNIIKKKK